MRVCVTRSAIENISHLAVCILGTARSRLYPGVLWWPTLCPIVRLLKARLCWGKHTLARPPHTDQLPRFVVLSVVFFSISFFLSIALFLSDCVTLSVLLASIWSQRLAAAFHPLPWLLGYNREQWHYVSLFRSPFLCFFQFFFSCECGIVPGRTAVFEGSLGTL